MPNALFESISGRGIVIEPAKIEIKTLIVRKVGIAHELVKSAIEWARRYGVHTIYLNCNTLRNRAHSFYEQEGFRKVKTSHFFEMSI
jgi:GNAT superfamily N-acetyltransferase